MRKYCGYFRADEFRSTNNTLTVAYISEIRWSLPYTFSGTVDFSYSKLIYSILDGIVVREKVPTRKILFYIG